MKLPLLKNVKVVKLSYDIKTAEKCLVKYLGKIYKILLEVTFDKGRDVLFTTCCVVQMSMYILNKLDFSHCLLDNTHK